MVCLIGVPTLLKLDVWGFQYGEKCINIKTGQLRMHWRDKLCMPYHKFNTGVVKIYNTHTIGDPPTQPPTLSGVCGGGESERPHISGFSYKAMWSCDVWSYLRSALFVFGSFSNVCVWSVCVSVCGCVCALRIYYLLYRKLPTVFVKGYHLPCNAFHFSEKEAFREQAGKRRFRGFSLHISISPTVMSLFSSGKL